MNVIRYMGRCEDVSCKRFQWSVNVFLSMPIKFCLNHCQQKNVGRDAECRGGDGRTELVLGKVDKSRTKG